ncbi:MAG: ABC transporter permease [Caldilineales bacterium]|nr:ABC transporter permease [Caldilineales bacterium]
MRSIVSTVITMLIVSITLFFFLEVGTGDVTVKILGIESTPEQRASYRAQLGLDAPAWQRYLDWLIGSDRRASRQAGQPLVSLRNPSTGEAEWWVKEEDGPVRWEMKEGEMVVFRRQADGSSTEEPATVKWETNEKGEQAFWGVNTNNSAVMWVKGSGETVWVRTKAGFRKEGDGPRQYIPLRKGLLRLDAGESLQTGRPVAVTLLPRVRNTLVLAGVAFLIVMPLALVLGVLAGANEGKAVDRTISIGGLAFTATPEFVTGIFLILIFGVWLQVFPAVAIFTSANAIFENPKLLVLPVMTLTAAELGYVARMTRSSMVEVMDAAFIRTAFIKGMPRRRVILNHALRNALLAPITIIMLHVNWLIGGVVVVESIFGYPGLGTYIYQAAVFGDVNAVEAAAMLLVIIAIVTRLLGDLAYTMLNPRIRYS